tara:strand:- start:77 stop:847 length:771 start_codon:yes stop_codon:yes gene_type:complete
MTTKIALTFWGTQKYLDFLPQWYGRLEKYFLPNDPDGDGDYYVDLEKHYFVFTDGELNDAPDNVTKMPIPHYGFPTTYHKTFEEMLKLEDKVADYDWLVSVDADLYAWEMIQYMDFFDDSKKYFGVHHPCHKVGFRPHSQSPGAYDVNPLSNAYIDDSIMDMSIYYQGCLWGGKIPYVFDMMRQIDKWTKEDVEKDVQARFYEESYMNKWFLTHREETHTVPPDYAYPEMFKDYCQFPNKMMHLAKDNKELDNNQW